MSKISRLPPLPSEPQQAEEKALAGDGHFGEMLDSLEDAALDSYHLYPLRVRTSSLHGRGVFAYQDIPAGALICLPPPCIKIISEAEYDRLSNEGDQRVIKSGTRFFANYFYYLDTDKPDALNYLNHAQPANCELQLGCLFALQDIAAGTELTLDYYKISSRNDLENILGMSQLESQKLKADAQAQSLSILKLAQLIRRQKSR